MCAYNIGVLFIFKYLAFALRNISELINTQLTIPNIVLPIGISFLHFKECLML